MNAPDLIEDHNKHIAGDYDNRPYLSKAFSYTAPGHLRAAAHLYGIETVPLKQARVLELGCAAGGNLLPFALAYPEATVVGVDLSPVQVAQGQEVVRDLGLKNMQLHAMDLAQITPDFGQFDYIIAHGVFSWVPPEVKQAMLRICRENLSPLGIAYISYNTYPGWKAGDVVRDAMTLHCHGAETHAEQLGRAKAMLALLSEGLAVSHGMGPSVRDMARSLQGQSDYYIAHEYLARFNTPCYLVEFADLALQSGLAYAGDAEPQGEIPAFFGQNVQLHLGLMALGQPKAMRQQYLDFAVGRQFRKSLLVHVGREALALPDLARLKDLRYAAVFTPYQDEKLAPEWKAFQNRYAQHIHSRDPVMLALIEAFNRAWPRTLGYEEILAIAAAILPQAQEARRATDEVLETLLRTASLYLALGAGPCDGVASMPLRPGFRYLFERSQDPAFSVATSNPWQETVRLTINEAQAGLLLGLEEGQPRAKLLAGLTRALQQGSVTGAGGQSYAGQRNLEAVAQKLLNDLLLALRHCGLHCAD